MVASKTLIIPAAENLTHQEAERLSELACACAARMVVLDVSGARDANTAAFARLVLLRRQLLQAQRDLRIAGLQGRSAQLFEVHRLDPILPRISHVPQPALRPVARVDRSALPADVSFPVAGADGRKLTVTGHRGL